ncbi:hypothetical protein PHMEG_0004988 [Phytophthora megakarya]|uniref:Uncharacterized protein n=1 Tax=Phytophthora megakarya TaxID=4795 RepID=A0A225WSK5_9STRA|nr:hypothetical protein PHMEG_0004988 [Phytophthora megakarya]
MQATVTNNANRNLLKRKKKIKTRRKQKKETNDFLETLASGFPWYIQIIGFKETDKEGLEQSSQRYDALSKRLKEKRLGSELNWQSELFKDFITTGEGDIEDLVD